MVSLRAYRELDAVIADNGGEGGLLSRIVDRVADGEGIDFLSASLGVSRGAMWSWLNGDENRMARYRMAREVCAESALDEVIPIVDDASPVDIGVARLRSEMRVKYAQLMNSRMYGNKQGNGGGGGGVTVIVNRDSVRVEGDDFRGRVIEGVVA